MNIPLLKEIRNRFEQSFSASPQLFRSPGRINLIGEHTDYNNGFVLPAAIDKNLFFAIAPNNSQTVNIEAYDINESISFQFGDVNSEKEWVKYFIGVTTLLKDKGLKTGFDCVFGGDIPLGAGLSSSAALTCGLAYSLNKVFSLGLNRKEIAFLAQKTEHEFIGVKCGIMDQFAVLFGKDNACIKLDCRNLDYEYIPLELGDYRIVLFDTGVKHSLASSAYNDRRSDCETGVAILKKENFVINSLRDVNPTFLNQQEKNLGEQVFQRCSYIVNEIKRTEDACEDLKNGKISSLGAKMYKTHYGLQHLYEVSCKELDFLVGLVAQNNNVIGARMMGGGFGGCTINLIHKTAENEIINYAKKSYFNKFNRELQVYQMPLANGVSECDL